MIALCNDVDQRSPHIRASFASLCRGRRRHISAPRAGGRRYDARRKRANRKRGSTGGRKERRPAETLRLKQNPLRDNYRMDGRRGWGTRRAGGGAARTNSGAGGGAKQKGESDGVVRIRTKGSKVEVIIMDKAEQRKQEMREAEADAKRRATRIVRVERRRGGRRRMR